MTAPFRVALSGDFRKADGSPVYPDFDLAPLRSAPGVEMQFQGNLLVRHFFEVAQAKHLGLLRRQLSDCFAQTLGQFSACCQFVGSRQRTYERHVE